MKYYFLPLAASLLLFSCVKQEQTPPVAGKWQLSEQKNAYLNGGDFQWKAVAYQHQLSLEPNGRFSERVPPNEEEGSYQLQASNSLQLQSQGQVRSYLYERTNAQTLVLKYKVREGTIEQKFVLIP